MQTEEDSVEVIDEGLHPLSHSFSVQLVIAMGSADRQTLVLRVEPGARLGSVENLFLRLLLLLVIHIFIVVFFVL